MTARLMTAEEVERRSARNRAARNAAGRVETGARSAEGAVLSPRLTRALHNGQPIPAAPKPSTRKASAIEERMWNHLMICCLHKFELPVRQFRPFPDRKWKLDFAWPRFKLALEVDGAVHRIKATFKSSFERGFWLLRAGWIVLHVGGDQVRSGEAVQWLEQLLRQAADRQEARGHR